MFCKELVRDYLFVNPLKVENDIIFCNKKVKWKLFIINIHNI